ncbi:MAG TPA: GAF domain-containing protein [Anaerolineae bacterium]|nr:GAF domain-containing protein [Anaerolineae bacterium]
MSEEGGGADIRTWQHELIMVVLRALVIVAPVVAAVGSYYDYTRQIYLSIPFYWVGYAILLVATFWRRVPYTAKVVAVVLLLYLLAILDFVSDGRGGSGRVFLLLLPFAASVFFNARRAVVSMGVVVVTMMGMAWAFSSGPLRVVEEVDSTDVLGWVSNTFVVLLIAAFMVASHHYLVPRMARALGEGRRLREALEQERADLEAQVNRRTADVTRRNVALQAAAQVARDAARMVPEGTQAEGTRGVDQVMEETVALISDAFGYYHCAIFVVDGEWAVLKAVSSTQGEAMLAEGHRLPVRSGAEGGVVGSAAASGEAHVALDVGRDAVFFDNPHLPETRSEVALPLRMGGDVIGVLDVQSRKAAAFDEADVAVLQTLADQIALAIANTRLVQDLQQSVEAERRAYGELSREGWRALLRQATMEERHDPLGVLAGDGTRREGARRAVLEARPVSETVNELPALAMPVKVRGQVIGVLDARKPVGTGGWTEQEQSLLETLSDQLGVALDGARLFQETQERAARDRLVSEMTARMRETLDMRTVLETAANELYEQLGLEKVTVYLSAEGVPSTPRPGYSAEEK